MSLEAISLLRFLPPGAASVGEDVTREDLREAGVGPWSAPGGQKDDLGALLGGGPALGEDFDEVVPLDDGVPDGRECVVVLRFSTG